METLSRKLRASLGAHASDARIQLSETRALLADRFDAFRAWFAVWIASFSLKDASPQAQAALALRLGLGAVFVIGGLAKLSRLLSPSAADAIVAEYMGPLGYINQTFQVWLFESPLGAVFTPWSFLTLLSAFELVAGVMLMVGLLIRPLALIWAFLLWSFVVSLPVVTTPGVEVGTSTYASPALLVQIRDVTLSGLFFALFNLGSGAHSYDASRFGARASLERDWNAIGLLLRLSLAFTFLIGGLFHGYHKIPTFGASEWALTIVGLGLLAGVWSRAFAAAATLVLVWYLLVKLGSASGVLGYFNSVKRELGLLAGTVVLTAYGAGRWFTLDQLIQGRWDDPPAEKRTRAAQDAPPARVAPQPEPAEPGDAPEAAHDPFTEPTPTRVVKQRRRIRQPA